MNEIVWRPVRWRGGDGFTGFIDGDCSVMIYPDIDGGPSPFSMKIFSPAYDADACRTGRHRPIHVSSLFEGRAIATEILVSSGVAA